MESADDQQAVNQLALFAPDGFWRPVKRCDITARLLADRHYSRQTIGAIGFMASGKTLVMTALDGAAVWGVIENMDPAGNLRWRCSIFRFERELAGTDPPPRLRTHHRGHEPHLRLLALALRRHSGGAAHDRGRPR